MNRRDSLLFSAVVSILYFLANWRFGGPAYLADEIGYLNNAAFLAGRFVDGASSYHAGYSLLLAPLFHFLSEPAHVWKGVMAVNALLWGGTFFSIAYVLRRLHPDLSRGKQLAALLVLAIYPANVVMSGYAFSQSAVALVFMLSLVGLLKSDQGRPTSIVLHSISTGFLFWIHPSGIAVVAASLLAVLAVSVRARSFRLLVLHFLIASAVVASYKLAFEPWRVAEMAAASGAQGAGSNLHYPSAGGVLRAAADWSYWPRILAVALGQLSYAVIATFGAAVAGAWVVVRGWGRQRNPMSGEGVGPELASGVFVVLSILAVVGLTAVAFGVSGPSRADHWVYGRYLDPYLLPLLAVGLGVGLRIRHAFVIALLVSAIGIAIVKGAQMSGPINWVNMSGLWPAVLVQEPLLWFLIGAAGLVLASMLPRTAALVLLVLAYSFSVSKQWSWHEQLLEGHSKPSAIIPFIRSNVTADCVAFDRASLKGMPPASMQAERIALYSFYLFDRTYRKLSAGDWPARCDGPLLTYDAASSQSGGAVALAREDATGLLLVVAKEQYDRYAKAVVSLGEDTYWNTGPADSRCVVAGCFTMGPAELARFSQVGELTPDGLHTAARAGYLFFGPYAKVRAGNYMVEVRGAAPVVGVAELDVVASRGAKVIARARLRESIADTGVLARLDFSLEDDVTDLEVRFKVSEQSRLVVQSYSVDLSPHRAPRNDVVERNGAELADLPRTVGGYSEGQLRADGRAGFLMHGPYRPLPAGQYRLEVTGTAASADASWFDVVSEKGRKTHFRSPVLSQAPQSPGLLSSGVLELEVPAMDIEVRAFVDNGDDVRISGYRLYRLEQREE